jgi:hypothetical protein
MTSDLKSYEIQDAALKMVDYLALMKLKHELLEARVTVLEERLKEKIYEATEDSSIRQLIKDVVDEDYVRDIIDDSYIQCIIDSEYITEIVRDNMRISID